MEAMSGNQYYQMFEDSYGRITNPPGGGGSIKADPSVIPPPTPNSIYDTASQQGNFHITVQLSWWRGKTVD